MLEAVFMDLDNTMFLFDEPTFYQGYYQRIMPYFANLVPPDQFMDRLKRSLQALSLNDGRVPNSLCFLDTFCYRYRARLPAIWQRFLDFYASEYDGIPVEGQSPPELTRVIDYLIRCGLKLVVASNPLFPLIAQEKRLAWTGLDSHRFELVTHIENMSFVKPSQGYFRQICEVLKLPASKCLMVGNDPVNDMAAGGAGLNTYLTTDACIGNYRWASMDEGKQVPRSYDFKGPLADLPKAVHQLMGRVPTAP